MALSDTARSNHGRQFGEGVSTLAQTDPELVEYFDNFAFDEVLAHGALDEHTRLLVVLAALVACQARGEYRVMLRAALDQGVSPTEVKEVLYQAVAYLGIGKVCEFLHLTNQVLTERRVALPLPGQSTTTPQTRFEKGWTAQAAIVSVDRLTAMHARPRRRAAPPTLAHRELLR